MQWLNNGGMLSKTIRLFDRSRTATDWQCQRRRYWQYEYDGLGVVPESVALELHMGTIIHDSLAAIATQHSQDRKKMTSPATGPVDIDQIAMAAQRAMYTSLMDAQAGESSYEAGMFANEQAALVEGLIRGFYRSVWPKLVEQYPTIIAIEREMTFKIDDHLMFMSKPDLVMADRDGVWVYVEYKSTSSKREDWVNSWETAIQLHSTVKAVEAELGQAPASVQIVGLYKGYQSYGKQSSPFCYAYTRPANPPFIHATTSYEYKAGLKRAPVWEMDGGVKQWVHGMPDQLLTDQFPISPPIFVKESMVESFFKQRQLREHEISLAMGMLETADEEWQKTAILDASFQQKFDNCQPAWGRGCPYKQLCFGDSRDPLSHGFEYRASHHQLERDQQAAEISDVQ